MIALIAALDRRGAIGVDGKLPWHLPDDLKRFKARTLGKPVLMGRKTADSLGRALPGRENLVLTRTARAPFEGMTAIVTVRLERVTPILVSAARTSAAVRPRSGMAPISGSKGAVTSR